VPQQPFDIIVVSTRRLVRETVAALLRARCGSRVLTRDSTEQGLAALPAAKALICDTSDMENADFVSLLDRARNAQPELRVIRIDDSSDAAAVEAAIAAVHAATSSGSLPHGSLTPLEGKVMLAVAAGLRNADIARRMRRSSKTIEKHRANALRKLRIRNVAQLTAYALRHKLLDGDSILHPLED